jgi:hypothetical protein
MHALAGLKGCEEGKELTIFATRPLSARSVLFEKTVLLSAIGTKEIDGVALLMT